MVGVEQAFDWGVLIKDYGPFIALVIFVIWDNRKREEKYQSREQVFIEETREREKRYIEREEKYINVIEGLSQSIEKISDDVAEIREKLDK